MWQSWVLGTVREIHYSLNHSEIGMALTNSLKYLSQSLLNISQTVKINTVANTDRKKNTKRDILLVLSFTSIFYMSTTESKQESSTHTKLENKNK